MVTGINGEEAVQIAMQEYPDLILLDVRMPRMTGYEACKLIKADPKLKDVPVVFLSAKGRNQKSVMAWMLALKSICSSLLLPIS